MKSFKEFIIEEKQRASIQAEADRRLAYERDVMGMKPNLEIEGNRRLQLVRRLEKQREQSYPDEAIAKNRDKIIEKEASSMADILSMPLLSAWLKGASIAAGNRRKANPTYALNREIDTLKNYPNDFDTGVREPDVKIIPSALRSKNKMIPGMDYDLVPPTDPRLDKIGGYYVSE